MAFRYDLDVGYLIVEDGPNPPFKWAIPREYEPSRDELAYADAVFSRLTSDTRRRRS